MGGEQGVQVRLRFNGGYKTEQPIRYGFSKVVNRRNYEKFLSIQSSMWRKDIRLTGPVGCEISCGQMHTWTRTWTRTLSREISLTLTQVTKN